MAKSTIQFALLICIFVGAVLTFQNCDRKMNFVDTANGPGGSLNLGASLTETTDHGNGGIYNGKLIYYHFTVNGCKDSGIVDPGETVAHDGKLVVEKNAITYDSSACESTPVETVTASELHNVPYGKDLLEFRKQFFTQDRARAGIEYLNLRLYLRCFSPLDQPIAIGFVIYRKQGPFDPIKPDVITFQRFETDTGVQLESFEEPLDETFMKPTYDFISDKFSIQVTSSSPYNGTASLLYLPGTTPIAISCKYSYED